MTPPRQDRSMVEEALVGSVQIYIDRGTPNERQLARLAKDLIDLAGDDPRVVEYINIKAAKIMNGEPAWT